MKKIYFSLVAMMIAAFSNTISAAEDFWYQNLAYKIISEAYHTVEVTKPSAGYTNLSGEIVIPSSVSNNGKNYDVVAVGASAFVRCAGITSVTFPESVTIIGNSAFWKCSNLSTINFAPNYNLKEIRSGAFSETAITEVTIPQSVERLSDAFAYNSELTTVNLHNGMLTAGVYQNCPKLKNITLPDGIELLGACMFSGCTSITSITIPNSVQQIQLAAFKGTSITSITIPSSVEAIEEKAFAECRNLKTVTIPSTVTRYGNGGVQMFADCTGLTSVNLQNDYICSNQFSGCTSLKTVTIGSNVTVFSNSAPFDGCPIETLTVGSDIAADIAKYSAAKSTLKTLTLNEGVTTLPENAFKDCSELLTVSMPSTLKSIGNSAFENCAKMTDVTVKMVKPFPIDESVFRGVLQHGYCDLHVPVGSKIRYSAREVWKEFAVITEDAGPGMIRGDVNADGTVDIADVVTVLNIMAEQ